MMKKRALLIFTIIAVVALVFTACAKSSPKVSDEVASSSVPTAAPENLLQKIKSEGTIKFGTEGTYAPFTFHDKDGKLTGFDIEIANEVAKRLGVKAEFIETAWDGIFAGLDAKRFDAIINEVTIRADRLEKYDFSDPYIVSKAVLIVKQDNDSIKTFADLKDKKSAQTLTSNFGKLAESYGATLEQVEGFNQAIDLLTSNRVDATINDSLSYLDFKKQQPDIQIKVVAEEQTKDEQGIMFNKGNKELVDAVNKALADMKSDGTYLRISETWFGVDVSK